MKALLKKDWLVLSKQMKIMLGLILLYMLIPGKQFTAFGVMFGTMLPMTALAYDEQSKWDALAAMMPYSPAQLVGVKYLLGLLVALGAISLSFVVNLVLHLVRQGAPQWADLSFLPGLFVGALLLIAVTLPPMFALGVERGRFVLFIILALVVFSTTLFPTQIAELTQKVSNLNRTFLQFVLPVLIIVLYVCSLLLSTRIYRRRER